LNDRIPSAVVSIEIHSGHISMQEWPAS